MRLTLEIALGIAFGVALIPIARRMITAVDAGASRHWKRLLAYGILAAAIAWFGIAMITELRREEQGRQYLERERLLGR